MLTSGSCVVNVSLLPQTNEKRTDSTASGKQDFLGLETSRLGLHCVIDVSYNHHALRC